MSELAPPADIDHRHRNDLVAGVLILGVCVWLWAASAEFPAVPQRYNRTVIGALALLSALQAVRGAVRWIALRRARRHDGAAEPSRDGSTDSRGPGRYLDVWLPRGALFLAGSVAYVWATPRVGYLASTVVFLVVGLGVGVGWRWRPMTAAVAVSVSMYLILDRVVNASVPEGFLL